MTTTAESIEAAAAQLGLSMTTQFVPWSQSRAKDEKDPSLNWRVTILRNGREVLTTDYGAGMGHCPAYKASVKDLGNRNCIMRDKEIRRECETGKAWPSRKVAIEPEFADVLHSLVSDADALDYADFADWASSMGYDTDSRKAEAIYRACLEIATRLRAALGDEGLATLRAAVQDY